MALDSFSHGRRGAPGAPVNPREDIARATDRRAPSSTSLPAACLSRAPCSQGPRSLSASLQALLPSHSDSSVGGLAGAASLPEAVMGCLHIRPRRAQHLEEQLLQKAEYETFIACTQTAVHTVLGPVVPCGGAHQQQQQLQQLQQQQQQEKQGIASSAKIRRQRVRKAARRQDCGQILEMSRRRNGAPAKASCNGAAALGAREGRPRGSGSSRDSQNLTSSPSTRTNPSNKPAPSLAAAAGQELQAQGAPRGGEVAPIGTRGTSALKGPPRDPRRHPEATLRGAAATQQPGGGAQGKSADSGSCGENLQVGPLDRLLHHQALGEVPQGSAEAPWQQGAPIQLPEPTSREWAWNGSRMQVDTPTVEGPPVGAPGWGAHEDFAATEDGGGWDLTVPWAEIEPQGCSVSRALAVAAWHAVTRPCPHGSREPSPGESSSQEQAGTRCNSEANSEGSWCCCCGGSRECTSEEHSRRSNSRSTSNVTDEEAAAAESEAEQHDGETRCSLRCTTSRFTFSSSTSGNVSTAEATWSTTQELVEGGQPGGKAGQTTVAAATAAAAAAAAEAGVERPALSWARRLKQQMQPPPSENCSPPEPSPSKSAAPKERRRRSPESNDVLGEATPREGKKRLCKGPVCSRGEKGARPWGPLGPLGPLHAGIFIFDWDDTFFPNSWLAGRNLTLGSDPSEYAAEAPLLNKLQQSGRKVLQAAARVGRVVLVTNAAQGWIDETCRKFLPGLWATVEPMRRVSARFHFDAPNCENPFLWKRLAFKEELDRHLSEHQECRTVLSIGDGPHERDAVFALHTEYSNGRRFTCKSLKLLELPSLEHLNVAY